MEINIKQGQSVKVINNLFNLSEKTGNYKKYQIVHPGSLLLNKVKKLNLALDDILLVKKEIEENNNSMDFDLKYEKVIFDYIKMIDELNDTYLLVIKSMTPYKYDYKNHKDVNEWLKVNEVENYKKYKDATFTENSYIRLLGDFVKHDDVRVAFLLMNNYKNNKVFGFYLYDVLDENELHGPNPKIHQEYKKSSTAFSFNHFILKTLGIVAYNLFWLNKIIFQKEKSKPFRDNTLYGLFKKVADLNTDFFPDEYQKKYLWIVKNKDFLTLKYQKYIGKENFDIIDNIKWSVKMFEHKNESNNRLPYLPLVY